MKSALFAGIEETELQGMLKCLSARRMRMERGQVLFSEGDAAGQMGVVLSGAVQVLQTDAFGTSTLLARLTEGELFAECFACAGVERFPVDVVCQSAGEVLLLEHVPEPCAHPCPAHTRLVRNLVTVLAQKNAQMMDRGHVLSRRSTRDKLLAFLDIQARASGGRELELPFTRQEMADYLCVDRSAMTVELMRLQRDGLIRVSGRKIRLTSPEKV